MPVTFVEIKCDHCGKDTQKSLGHYNRSKKEGHKMFCSKKCSSVSRRMSKAGKVEAKRLYDIEYRRRNQDMLKLKREKYYSENAKELYRRRREKLDNDEYRARHAAYCRRPDQREKERINRYKRRWGENWRSMTKFCISCEQTKFILEFKSSNVFPDGRRHICDECENYQKTNYGYSTKLTLAAMKSRRYTNLMWEDFARHPYLIEANKFLILLKRELQ